MILTNIILTNNTDYTLPPDSEKRAQHSWVECKNLELELAVTEKLFMSAMSALDQALYMHYLSWDW